MSAQRMAVNERGYYIRGLNCLKCEVRFLPKDERDRYCSKCGVVLWEIWGKGQTIEGLTG